MINTNEHYKIFLTKNDKLVIRDKREPLVDVVSEVMTPWKSLFNRSIRHSYNLNKDLESDGYTLFTYPSGEIVLANPVKGDYVHPGYESISQEISRELRGYERAKYFNKARFKPVYSHLIVNPDMTNYISNSEGLIDVGLNTSEQSAIGVAGWRVSINSSASRYTNVRCVIGPSGVRIVNPEEGFTPLMHQTLYGPLLKDCTRLVFRITGSVANVILGTDILVKIPGPDNDWLWEGEANGKDRMLGLVLTEQPVSKIEVIDA